MRLDALGPIDGERELARWRGFYALEAEDQAKAKRKGGR